MKTSDSDSPQKEDGRRSRFLLEILGHQPAWPYRMSSTPYFDIDDEYDDSELVGSPKVPDHSEPERKRSTDLGLPGVAGEFKYFKLDEQTFVRVPAVTLPVPPESKLDDEGDFPTAGILIDLAKEVGCEPTKITDDFLSRRIRGLGARFVAKAERAGIEFCSSDDFESQIAFVENGIIPGSGD